MKPKLSAIDLFCGCGGTTVGLKQANFDVLCAIDLAEAPLLAFKANHPEVTIKKQDIQTIDTDALLKELSLAKGELDILAGCPPCQGFSSMRTKNGKLKIKDKRNDLISEFYRFTKAFLPKTVMLENVPGLATSHQFAKFIKNMEQLNYIGDFKVLNAKNYGVAQSRRRLIYVAGHRKKVILTDQKFETITVQEKIQHLPKAGSSGDWIHDLPEKRTPRIKKMFSLIPKDGGSRTSLPEEYILPCHKRSPTSFTDVYGRMSWGKVSPTITGGCSNPSKGRFLHPEEDRCITMREASLLQGFPENYIFPTGLTKTQLSLMIGNALPAPFIAAHAKELAEICR